MSRAFVKEPDEGVPDELPDRPISEHRNYVTPAGLRELQEKAGRLETQRLELLARQDEGFAGHELAPVDRDLRYCAARLASAILVDLAGQAKDQVQFGAAVTVEQPDGARRTFIIVGEDEADLAASKISYVSPLAAALLGARTGDRVTWKRPAGDIELTVAAIEYPES
jgi:transcription elongation factor GreB